MKIVVPKAPWSAAARRRLPLAFFTGRTGGASPAAGPAAFMPGIFQGGVEPPHSKALRALSWIDGPDQCSVMQAAAVKLHSSHLQGKDARSYCPQRDFTGAR